MRYRKHLIGKLCCWLYPSDILSDLTRQKVWRGRIFEDLDVGDSYPNHWIVYTKTAANSKLVQVLIS